MATPHEPRAVRPCCWNVGFALAMGMCWAAVLGCSRPTRVAGVVTLDGEPLPAAVVQFFPISPQGQTAATQTDDKGRYWVNVSPNPMRVVIRAQKVVGQVEDGGSAVDAVEELVPVKYRDPGSVLLKVEPRAGEVTAADFALTSDKK